LLNFGRGESLKYKCVANSDPLVGLLTLWPSRVDIPFTQFWRRLACSISSSLITKNLCIESSISSTYDLLLVNWEDVLLVEMIRSLFPLAIAQKNHRHSKAGRVAAFLRVHPKTLEWVFYKSRALFTQILIQGLVIMNMLHV
jgi:hypothetical protein